MTDMMRIVTIGALLHDIGKAIIRASGERKTHSQLGADFLRPFCDISEAGEAVVRCVRYHHGRDLRGAHLTPDDLAFIVYEADNLAAGIDRRDRDDGTAAFGFDPERTLENVFNVFDGVKRKSYFPLQSLNAALPMNMPVADRPLASRGKYAGIVETLSANFKEMPPQEMKGNELLRILEDTLSYAPSSTAKGEVCDISLFDHVKITAAVASSLLRYMQQHGIADYKNFCCTRGLENRKKDTLLFISADFSGIQKFIYRVQTKGAMRMLRGRSFYLTMVMEHIIDEILEKLSLSRANLIYSGGGHFYMMADNSEETKKILEEAFRSVNDRLLHDYGTSLYVAAGWVPFSAEELLPGKEKKDNIFRRVNRVIAEKKQSRYSASAIADMIDEDSVLHPIKALFREALQAGSILEFTVGIDDDSENGMGHFGIKTFSDLKVVLQNYLQFQHDLLKEPFKNNAKEEIDDLRDAKNVNLRLGAGTGFLMKTLLYSLAPDPYRAVMVTREWMQREFPEGKHFKDDKISPHTLNLVYKDGYTYLMGLAGIKEEPLC